MPFDDSGQVYEERLWKPQFKDHSLRVYSEVHPRPPLLISARGARSLEDAAMNTVLRNLDAVTAPLLQRIPSALVSRIWTEICRNKLKSVRIWKEFAAAKCENLARTQDWRISDPIHGQLLRQATSTSFDWLTTIKIHGHALDVSDFMAMSAVQNVAQIYISYSSIHGEIFSNRILAAWAADARQHESFQRLRGLFIQGCENISGWALQHIIHFPALTKFFTHHCGNMNLPADDSMRGWDCNSPKIYRLLCRRLEEESGAAFSDLVESALQQQSSSIDEIEFPILTIRLEPAAWRPDRGHHFGRLFCFEKIAGHRPEALAQDLKPRSKKRKVSNDRQNHLSKRTARRAKDFSCLIGL